MASSSWRANSRTHLGAGGSMGLSAQVTGSLDVGGQVASLAMGVTLTSMRIQSLRPRPLRGAAMVSPPPGGGLPGPFELTPIPPRRWDWYGGLECAWGGLGAGDFWGELLFGCREPEMGPPCECEIRLCCRPIRGISEVAQHCSIRFNCNGSSQTQVCAAHPSRHPLDIDPGGSSAPLQPAFGGTWQGAPGCNYNGEWWGKIQAHCGDSSEFIRDEDKYTEKEIPTYCQLLDDRAPCSVRDCIFDKFAAVNSCCVPYGLVPGPNSNTAASHALFGCGVFQFVDLLPGRRRTPGTPLDPSYRGPNGAPGWGHPGLSGCN